MGTLKEYPLYPPITHFGLQLEQGVMRLNAATKHDLHCTQLTLRQSVHCRNLLYLVW